jgi:hypothetical protein
MYYRRKVEELDSLESWIFLDRAADIDDIKISGKRKVLVSNTGSINLPYIIRNTCLADEVIGFTEDPDLAFDVLDKGVYDKSVVDNLSGIAKDYKNEILVISSEYDKDTSWNTVTKDISDASVLSLVDGGYVNIFWEKSPDEYISTASKEDIASFRRIEEDLNKAYDSARDGDKKGCTIHFMMSLSRIKAPRTDRRALRDVLQEVTEYNIMPDDLIDIISRMEEINIKYLAFMYLLTSKLITVMMDRNKGFRILGTSAVSDPRRCGVRIYGSIHRVKGKDLKKIEDICARGPVFPNFGIHGYNELNEVIETIKYDDEMIRDVTVKSMEIVKDKMGLL